MPPYPTALIHSSLQHRWLAALMLLCLSLMGGGTALAQQPGASVSSTPIPQPELTADLIHSRMETVQNNAGLDEAARNNIVNVYNQALEKLQETEQWIIATEEFNRARAETPALLQSIQIESEQLQQELPPDPASIDSLALLESRLLELESQLAREQADLAALDGEFQRRTDRRIVVPGLRAAARERLQDVERQLNVTDAAGESAEMVAARLTYLLARKRACEAEIQAYESELLSYEARGELLPARRDLESLRVARTDRAVRAFRDAVNDRRRAEAEDATRQARLEASRVHPAAGQIAIQNEALAQLRSGSDGLAAKIERTSNELQSTEAVLTRVTSLSESVKSKVEAIGLTDAIGYLLRNKRAELPSVSVYRQRNKARQREVRAVQLRQIQLAEQRSDLADGMELQIQGILGELPAGVISAKRTEIELTVRELLRTQQGLLDALIRDMDRYFTLLIDLDGKEKDLIEGTETLEAYIDERILWVPSGEPFGLTALRASALTILWLLHPDQGWAALQALSKAGRDQVLLLAPSLLLILLLFMVRPLIVARLQQEGQLAAKGSTQTILPTVRAFGNTVLLAVMRPAAVALLAWLLSSSPSAPEFAAILAAALNAVALVDLMIELFRAVCMKQGLGEAHFGWPSRAMELVRKTARAVSWIGLPLVFLYAALQAQPDAVWRESLGRLALVGIVIVLAFALHRLFRPRNGVFLEYTRTHPQSWICRLQRVWHPVAVGLPIALAVIALWGYTYTAYHLAQRLYGTAWLLLAMLLMHAAGQRWLLMTRRRLLVEQARKTREAAMAEMRAQKEGATTQSELAPVVADAETDFASLDSQARQMLRVALGVALVVGLWWVWVDVLPALNMLRRVDLWKMTVPVAADITGTGLPGEEIVWVTLADVALSLIFLGFTIAGVKNIPGLLEITLLQRLNLERSLRFAITALSRYVLVVIGSVAAFGAVGIGWNKVQWLVAAMTVGLGFGLQEIFANFVSGLIILFERPIRIGDIVTVGETTGYVSQIRMRATTITDFERRELLVPNKEFITGNLVNWTLSNAVTRIHITVGVAYGSDTEKARALMQSLAERCEFVLEDPAPFTVFKSFGDNSLELRLYVYLPRMEVMWDATNELTTGIDRAFKDAGISIAFPQRDIHVDTLSPIEIRMAPQPTTPS